MNGIIPGIMIVFFILGYCGMSERTDNFGSSVMNGLNATIFWGLPFGIILYGIAHFVIKYW